MADPPNPFSAQNESQNNEKNTLSKYSHSLQSVSEKSMITENENSKQRISVPRPERPSLRPEEIGLKMRKQAFSNWIIFVLDHKEKIKIEKLEVDLQDGKVLIQLLETLYQTTLVSDRSKLDLKEGIANFSSLRLENIKIALNFMSERLGLEVSTVTPQDINHGNLQQILVVLWALIQRVQLTERGMNEERLLRWIESRLQQPHTPLHSLTDCFIDRHVLGSFINSFKSNLFIPSTNPPSSSTSTTTSTSTSVVKEIMELAEKHLGIPVLFDANLLESHPSSIDTQAVVTYLSLFLTLDKTILRVPFFCSLEVISEIRQTPSSTEHTFVENNPPTNRTESIDTIIDEIENKNFSTLITTSYDTENFVDQFVSDIENIQKQFEERLQKEHKETETRTPSTTSEVSKPTVETHFVAKFESGQSEPIIVVKYSPSVVASSSTPQSTSCQTIDQERKLKESNSSSSSSSTQQQTPTTTSTVTSPTSSVESERVSKTSETKPNENVSADREKESGSVSLSKISQSQRKLKRMSRDSKSTETDRSKSFLRDLKLKLKFPSKDLEKVRSIPSESSPKSPKSLHSDPTRSRSHTIGDESVITLQSSKTPMTPPSDTSSKKTHDRDFEEKSRDKWFKRTSHNLKNLFKFKTKEKNLEKDNTKRHSPEKSANQNEWSQVLSPSSTKESLQSKMPTIQELSTSSSPSTSPRKSPRSKEDKVTKEKGTDQSEEVVSSFNEDSPSRQQLKATRSSGEFRFYPSHSQYDIPFISPRHHIQKQEHFESPRKRDFRKTFHVTMSSQSLIQTSESNVPKNKTSDSSSSDSTTKISHDSSTQQRFISYNRHSLSAEFLLTALKSESQKGTNNRASSLVSENSPRHQLSTDSKGSESSEGVNPQFTSFKQSKSKEENVFKSSPQLTTTNKTPSQELEQKNEEQRGESQTEEKHSPRKRSVSYSGVSLASFLASTSNSSQEIKQEQVLPSNTNKPPQSNSADSVLGSEEIEDQTRVRAFTVAEVESSTHHARKSTLPLLTEEEHKKKRKRYSKPKNIKSNDSDLTVTKSSKSKHSKPSSARSHLSASPKLHPHPARPMSAMITSSEQASLTGSQPERKRDSFKQPHPFFFILSPEKEKWYKEQVQKVIKVQALIRGKRERKIYAMLLHRKNVAKEIVNSEETYVENLKKIIKLFKVPLQNNPHLLTSPADIKTIFSEIDVILNYNSMMLGQLKDRLSRWTHFQRLGDIFLRMTDFLKVYTQYVKNFNDALRQVSLCNQNREFREFLQKTREDPLSMNLTFIDFLVMPVQRVPRYVILLTDLLNCTPKNHEDYNDLKSAVEKINLICVYVNEKKRDAENLDLVLNIQEKLVPGKKETADRKNLAEAHRRYIREGYLTSLKLSNNNDVVTKSKHHYFILFNDLLVETKPKKGVLEKLTYVHIGSHPKEEKLTQKPGAKLIYIRDIKIDHESVVVENPISHIPNAFTLVNKENSFTFLCSSPTEKDEWVTSIKNNIATLIKNKQSQETDPTRKS